MSATSSRDEGQTQSAPRVLVVEDDQDTADSLALLLRSYGYSVQVAADGLAALEVAQGEQPDVVLLDLGLPGLDGWQVAKAIRARGTAKRPLIIAVSGYGQEVDRWRSAEAGIQLHLVKPVDPDQLRSVVAEFQGIKDVS